MGTTVNETDLDQEQDADQETEDVEESPEDISEEELRENYQQLISEHTKVTQERAALREQVARFKTDSELLSNILNDDEIYNIVDQRFGKGGSASQVKIDPNTDPQGWLSAKFDEMETRITKQVENKLNPLLQDRQEQSAQQEYDALLAEIPALKSISVDAINDVLDEHPTLSLRQAVSLIKPDVFVRRTRGNMPPKPDKSSGSTQTVEETNKLLTRAQELRQQAEASKKSGISIRQKIANRLGGNK
jgi:hypothetical protein